MFTSILAGAILTPEQFALIVAVFIALCIAFVVGVTLFIRSSWRLATRETKSQRDIIIVAIGLLIVLLPVTAAASGQLRDRATHRQVSQVLDPVSTLPEGAVTSIYRAPAFDLIDADCEVIIARLSSGFGAESNDLVRDESLAFEDSGWHVTNHERVDQFGEAHASFQADGTNETVVFLGPNDWGRLEYRITDHDCAETEFGLESR